MGELLIIKPDVDPVINDLRNRLIELNLNHYASEAAEEMEFKNSSEFNEAVKRAMEICINCGVPVDENFRLIFKCSYETVELDYKLSDLAYSLVQLNGSSVNPRVAHMQIELLQNYH